MNGGKNDEVSNVAEISRRCHGREEALHFRAALVEGAIGGKPSAATRAVIITERERLSAAGGGLRKSRTEASRSRMVLVSTTPFRIAEMREGTAMKPIAAEIYENAHVRVKQSASRVPPARGYRHVEEDQPGAADVAPDHHRRGGRNSR